MKWVCAKMEQPQNNRSVKCKFASSCRKTCYCKKANFPLSRPQGIPIYELLKKFYIITMQWSSWHGKEIPWFLQASFHMWLQTNCHTYFTCLSKDTWQGACSVRKGFTYWEIPCLRIIYTIVFCNNVVHTDMCRYGRLNVFQQHWLYHSKQSRLR